MSGTPKAAIQPQVLRSQLGRVRGLGAARSGTATWRAQRLGAVALVPLSLWFVYAALHLAGQPRAAVAHWVANPINAALLAALVLAAFHHGQLGLQVVVEDYVHVDWLRISLTLLIKGLAALLALMSLIAVLKLAFTG
jgi:succinate dehydrogenase / fumarate reductase membrane anchor subunit